MNKSFKINSALETKINYLDNLPPELLDIIYHKAKKIEWTSQNTHGYEYCRLYDCSKQHRLHRKKAICYYDYSAGDWRFWDNIV